MTVLNQKEYDRAMVLLNEVMQKISKEKKSTCLILSEAFFLVIAELCDLPVKVFEEATKTMLESYEKNKGTIIQK